MSNVITEIEDPVAIIRLNRPEKLNAFTFTMIEEIRAAVNQAATDDRNGVTAGGGFVLAMMCDLRFASESASFATVFSKRGLVAEHGTSWLLPRIVGLSRALDLLWSSRRSSLPGRRRR